MKSAVTCVLRFAEASGQLQNFRTAVSLHSHTHHSQESLELLPAQISRIPVFGAVVHSKLRRYQESSGRRVNFEGCYWTPPVSPAEVLATEAAQIEGLDLAPLVSVSDHDSIAAGLDLQNPRAGVSHPISVEWTVPYGGDTVHLGIHHLRPDSAVECMRLLAAYTQGSGPDTARLQELLAYLSESPETLIILNHPCWDIARIGNAQHDVAVRAFLSECGVWIHALEVNGLRSCRENRAALHLAQEYQMPTVAGGDRHGRHPNAVLNLTRAACWAEFVAEVRGDRRSEILVLPAYEQPLGLRQLETVADALRCYPEDTSGRSGFTDRTFVHLSGDGLRPLSYYWDRGVPPWLNPFLRFIVFLGSAPARPVLCRTVFRQPETDLMVQAEDLVTALATSGS